MLQFLFLAVHDGPGETGFTSLGMCVPGLVCSYHCLMKTPGIVGQRGEWGKGGGGEEWEKDEDGERAW